ncbi:MAG: hypothetical protein ACR2MX_09730, partial [Cyclobacteriaceae bacterium]
MQEHYNRFPNTVNGLNKQEKQILEIAASGIYSKRQLVGLTLQQQDRWYGFGDLQYFLYLQRLEALLSIQDVVNINQLGQEVFAGEKAFLEIQPEKVDIGGATNIEYQWDPFGQQLVKHPQSRKV